MSKADANDEKFLRAVKKFMRTVRETHGIASVMRILQELITLTKTPPDAWQFATLSKAAVTGVSDVADAISAADCEENQTKIITSDTGGVAGPQTVVKVSDNQQSAANTEKIGGSRKKRTIKKRTIRLRKVKRNMKTMRRTKRLY